MLPVNGQAFLHFGDEGEFVRDKDGNGNFVRKKAKGNHQYAGKHRHRHDQGINPRNVRFAQGKGKRQEKAKEHGQESLDAGE